jgi:dTDP-glucose 4,6-dehydratase
MTRCLLSGASGFVGSHFAEHLWKNTDWHVVAVHRSSIAGDLERLGEVIDRHPEWKKRLTIIRHDLRDSIHELVDNRIGEIDYVFHLGASSHVDRSITYPVEFLEDNVKGTVNLLEWLRKRNSPVNIAMHEALVKFGNGHIAHVKPVKRFLYFSTDEVYGPAPEGVFYKETDRVHPGNPYSASKMAAESFCMAYENTYKLPIIITRCMNIFGERQHPEKYIPLVMKKILSGDKLLIHSDPTKTQPGKRHYLHARNIAAACLHLIDHGKVGEIYNVVGDKEVDNLALAKLIHEYVVEWDSINGPTTNGLPALNYELVDFHSSRPGHDLRYALNGDKLKATGFEYPAHFEESLRKTVFWTLDNRDKWLGV